MAVYYATKAFILHFSEAIANELEGTGVTVTALCPGRTATGFEARASMQDSKLMQSGLMSSASVAKAGYVALLQGKTLIIPGFPNRMIVGLLRLLPRKMVTRFVRSVQERRPHLS